MGDPRPEKVAVVEEVREKFTAADGVVLTEYRGLDVKAMAELRRALRAVGGEYKIYKNTLVRLAARELDLDIDELLTGPTAIAFVGEGPDGQSPDAAAVAKALRDFAKTHEALTLKGGLLEGKLLDTDELRALADLPSREVLLAQLAGALQAPMARFAGLLAAVPRDFAYGLKALIDAGGATPGAESTDAAAESAESTDAAAESAESTDAAAESAETPDDQES